MIGSFEFWYIFFLYFIIANKMEKNPSDFVARQIVDALRVVGVEIGPKGEAKDEAA